MDYYFEESPPSSVIESFSIGGLAYSETENWEGFISKVSTFNYPLTPVEVSAIYWNEKRKIQ